MLKEILLVGVGGFIGSVLRYLVSTAMISATLHSPLPLGTFTVNVVGSLLIGIGMVWTGGSGAYFLCVVGFCGGFTTFSTFSAEMLAMVREGNLSSAGLYALASVFICITATWVGIVLGEKFKL